MSKKQVKRYSLKIKSKVVLEALKGDKTLNEIGSQFQIPPANIKVWKKQFLENMEIVFNKDSAVDSYKSLLKQKDKDMDDLYRQIGKLNTKLDWAKKKSEEFGLEY